MYVPFSVFCVLRVCKCVLFYCHRVSTQLQLNIQGDSGGICSTLGNDSMRDSKQKSSYEHGSDFERLPRLW
jgi:hypothetical protein